MTGIEKKYVESILGRMVHWKERQESAYTISPLSGGLTNRSFLIRAEVNTYVLRLGGKHTVELGIDREKEAQAAKIASLAGINVPLIDFLLPQGHMLTQWVEGRSFSREEFNVPTVIHRTATLLTRVHSLNSSIGLFNPYKDICDRIKTVKSHKGYLPANLNLYKKTMERILDKRKSGPLSDPVLCHNDPFYNNFMDCGDRLLLLDWEFAGRGDALFDIASVTQMLSHDNRDLFLKDYLVNRNLESLNLDIVKEHLEMVRFVMCFWSGSWALIQARHNHIDHDFSQMAENIFKGMDEFLKSNQAEIRIR